MVQPVVHPPEAKPTTDKPEHMIYGAMMGSLATLLLHALYRRYTDRGGDVPMGAPTKPMPGSADYGEQIW